MILEEKEEEQTIVDRRCRSDQPIVHEFARVHPAIAVPKGTDAVLLVLLKAAFVDFARSVSKRALAMTLAVRPLALVVVFIMVEGSGIHTAGVPIVLAVAVLVPILPLANVLFVGLHPLHQPFTVPFATTPFPFVNVPTRVH